MTHLLKLTFQTPFQTEFAAANQKGDSLQFTQVPKSWIYISLCIVTIPYYKLQDHQMWHELVTLSSLNAFIFEAHYCHPFSYGSCAFVKEHYNRDIFLDCKFCRSLFCHHCPFALHIHFGSQIPKVSAYRSGIHCWSQNILSGHASQDYSTSQSGLKLQSSYGTFTKFKRQKSF
jgi:hypothetical protein